MTHRVRGVACLLTVFGTAAVCRAADPPELAKIDRRIAKEPAYTSKQPLYGLVVFGPAATTRTWLVLDQSKEGGKYDVLYFDRNGNGDLTDAGERYTTTGDEFELGSFTDPDGRATHTKLKVRLTDKTPQTVMVGLNWRDRHRMGGGYPADPESGYMTFGATPAAAPVLWADGDGPFQFQRWYGGRLTIGAEDEFKVFVGRKGVGPSSFWAFTTYVVPKEEGAEATLIYTDREGAERTVSYRLTDRC